MSINKTYALLIFFALQNICSFGMEVQQHCPEITEVLSLLMYASKQCNTKTIRTNMMIADETNKFDQECRRAIIVKRLTAPKDIMKLQRDMLQKRALQGPEHGERVMQIITCQTIMNGLIVDAVWAQNMHKGKIALLLDAEYYFQKAVNYFQNALSIETQQQAMPDDYTEQVNVMYDSLSDDVINKLNDTKIEDLIQQVRNIGK